MQFAKKILNVFLQLICEDLLTQSSAEWNPRHYQKIHEYFSHSCKARKQAGK